MELQTPGLSADTQSDTPSRTAGSSIASDSDLSTTGTAALESLTLDSSAVAQSDVSSSTAGSPTANDADTSNSHTALAESQTPGLVQGPQSDESSTTASSPLANEAPTDTKSDNASASSTGKSEGANLFSTAQHHAAVGLSLLFSFIAL
jgi:hypothetical protein